MVKIFVSYSHEDEDVWTKLRNHLASMERDGLIEIWFDRKLLPGQSFDHEIKKNIADADIVLLLVSSNFISSDYCHNIEMRSAMELHKAGNLWVVPIILSSCDWRNSPFGNLLAVPKDGKPISSWNDLNDALFDSVEQLKRVIEELNKNAPNSSNTPNDLSPQERATSQPKLRTSSHELENDNLTTIDQARRRNMAGSILDKFISLSRLPATNRGDWLENAAEGTDFLKKSSASDETVLYANGPHMFIHSVLAPAKVLAAPNHADLYRGLPYTFDCWGIQKVIEGGKDHRVYLSPPLSQYGCKSLVGGEKLIFMRSSEGIRNNEPPPIELSQKLVHALELHFLEERNAYCRLNKRGDIEDIINVYNDTTGDPWQDVRAVTIRSHQLATYMALTATSLVTFFNFTRFSPSDFDDWPARSPDEFEARDIFYRHGKFAEYASYQKGHIIFRTKRTLEDLVEEWKSEEDNSNREYATFLIIDYKNDGEVIETSCSPNHIVNYFTESNLPWEMSPAFFCPEVLHRYKSDPEKYTIDNGIIECRGAWDLRSYDINDAGQVHAYIGDLAKLPYEEQLYWKSFNENPKAGISERSLQTDFQGQFPTTLDHLEDLKSIVVELDKKPPTWWKLRGNVLISAVHDPATDSVSEWGNEILALDQLVVEGLQLQPLREIIKSKGSKVKESWRSLKLIEVCLVLMGRTKDQAKDTVAPLLELHSLRNIAKAHGDPKGRQSAVKSARKSHGSLRNHFTEMSRRLVVALNEIIATLPK